MVVNFYYVQNGFVVVVVVARFLFSLSLISLSLISFRLGIRFSSYREKEGLKRARFWNAK